MTKKILSIVNNDKREKQMSSVAMEKEVIRSFEHSQEVCTDAHSQISAPILLNAMKIKLEPMFTVLWSYRSKQGKIWEQSILSSIWILKYCMRAMSFAPRSSGVWPTRQPLPRLKQPLRGAPPCSARSSACWRSCGCQFLIGIQWTSVKPLIMLKNLDKVSIIL